MTSTAKHAPMDTAGGNPMWSAQMALYAHAAGLTGPITFIDPKGGVGMVVDFDPQLPHVEQIAADLTVAKDEVLAGVRALTWQPKFPSLSVMAKGFQRSWIHPERTVWWT